MLFVFLFSGTIYISYTLREGLLEELNVFPQYFAMIISTLTIISGVFVSFQEIIFFIVMIFVLLWMKPRFGLKAEEYNEKDIKFKECAK